MGKTWLLINRAIVYLYLCFAILYNHFSDINTDNLLHFRWMGINRKIKQKSKNKNKNKKKTRR